jgi:hypothetical protein
MADERTRAHLWAAVRGEPRERAALIGALGLITDLAVFSRRGWPVDAIGLPRRHRGPNNLFKRALRAAPFSCGGRA